MGDKIERGTPSAPPKRKGAKKARRSPIKTPTVKKGSVSTRKAPSAAQRRASLLNLQKARDARGS